MKKSPIYNTSKENNLLISTVMGLEVAYELTEPLQAKKKAAWKPH